MVASRGPVTECLVPGYVTVYPYTSSAMTFIGGDLGGSVEPIELGLSQRGDPLRTAARAVATFGAYYPDGVPSAVNGRRGCISKIYSAVLCRPRLA